MSELNTPEQNEPEQNASGKKVLVISTEFGTEQDELVVPYRELKKLGYQVSLATPSGDPVQTLVHDRDPGEQVPADGKLSELAKDEFDILVLPGGTINADKARIDDCIVSTVAAQVEAQRPVAAICHAPWILINAEVAKGKTLTSYKSIRLDLQNDGATWKDVEVYVCDAKGWRLITSRNPGDLKAFVGAIDDTLKTA